MMKKDRKTQTLNSINVPIHNNKLLKKALDRVNSNLEIKTLWKVINVNAIDRLSMTDHGIVHFQIVANIALRLARLLKKHKVKLSVITDHEYTHDHGELIIFLASIMHDLGMSISRHGHEEFSLIVANRLLCEVVDFLPLEEQTVVISEALHAIISHRKGGTPYTVEAGILRVADALDMSKGRSRIPYESGAIDIHSVSAAAIENIEISEGSDRPIKIDILMNNSAGLFQIDELLKSKLRGSGIEKYVEIRAFIKRRKEKKLLNEFLIKI